MGIVKIASLETPEEAGTIWNQFLDFSNINQEQRFCVVSNNIQNGCRFFIKANQSFVLFSGDKFIDSVLGPGMFVCLDVFENGKSDEHQDKHTKILRENNSSAFAGTVSSETQMEGIVFNRQEGKSIRFTFDEAKYFDCKRNMDIVLQGVGYFILTQADPLVNYALCDFDKNRLLEYTLPSFTEEEINQFAIDLENAFEKTLVKLSNIRFSYERLPYVTDYITSLVNEEMDDGWVLRKGIMAKTIEFTEFYPDEKSMLGLVEYERKRVLQKEKQSQGTNLKQNFNYQQNADYNKNANVKQDVDYSRNENYKQDVNYQQNMNYQSAYMNGGMVQEYVIRTGSCDWYKDGTSTMQGKATLTNKRFSFVTSKLAQVDKILFNTLDDSDRGFEFLLSDVLNVIEDNQGASYGLIFILKNGMRYRCSFSKFFTVTTGEWFANILGVLNQYK